MGLFGNKDLEYDVLTLKEEVTKLKEIVKKLCSHKQVEYIGGKSYNYKCILCGEIFRVVPKKSKLVKMKYCEVD